MSHYNAWRKAGEPDVWHGNVIPAAGEGVAAKRLPESERLILKTLIQYAGMPLSTVDIMEETGLIQTTTCAAIRRLEARGDINKSGGGYGREVCVWLEE